MAKTSSSELEAPEIPDHEILALIGEGAYGQVWLARAVTGALRAIKVVRRSDYPDGSLYEREFDGIKKFEPVSREHPGLVSVLQVGRHDARKNVDRYYYYVMELGDDVERGQDVDPECYRADTFGERARRLGASDPAFCIEQGAILAEGLGHLHRHELIHRDIKPSNIVFIDGKACLADIGLVAAAGDRTFVGTEGFVAPEGPGSASADIYGLGMVLYELSTGKDRLDFPDVPTIVSEEVDRALWRRVNRVVCRSCATRPERRYQTGEEMAQALRGEIAADPSRKRPLLLAAGAALGVLGLLAIPFLKDSEDSVRSVEQGTDSAAGGPETPDLAASSEDGPTLSPGASASPPIQFSDSPEVAGPGVEPFLGAVDGFEDRAPEEAAAARDLQINSFPAGAEIYKGERYYGTTPKLISPGPADPTSFTLRLAGYKSESVEYQGDMDDREQVEVLLEPFVFPQEGLPWTNSRGQEFIPNAGGHRASQPLEADGFLEFARATGLPVAASIVQGLGDEGRSLSYAAITARDARLYADWLLVSDRDAGVLTDEHSYVIVPVEPASVGIATVEDPGRGAKPAASSLTKGLGLFSLSLETVQYGSAYFTSEPGGAKVFQNGRRLGETPLHVSRVREGPTEFELRLPDYKTIYLPKTIKASEHHAYDVAFEPGEGVDFQHPYNNSLEMLFLPLDGMLIGAWEVRRKDMARFISEVEGAQKEALEKAFPSLSERSLHPVTEVTLEEAQAFCAWLTLREQGLGQISGRHEYRLPSDLEWSRVAGLPLEKGKDPASRSGVIRGLYPWGYTWPPPSGEVNLADAGSLPETGVAGYSDGWPETAPVDVVAADERGLYHLAGNVWEWTSDLFGGSDRDRFTARGGGYLDAAAGKFLSSARRPASREARHPDLGFRCVLVRTTN